MSANRRLADARTAQEAAVVLLAHGFWPVAIHSRGVEIGRDKTAEGRGGAA